MTVISTTVPKRALLSLKTAAREGKGRERERKGRRAAKVSHCLDLMPLLPWLVPFHRHE
jgi:hypothetical protein